MLIPYGGQHTAEFLVAVGRCACASTHHLPSSARKQGDRAAGCLPLRVLHLLPARSPPTPPSRKGPLPTRPPPPSRCKPQGTPAPHPACCRSSQCRRPPPHEYFPGDVRHPRGKKSIHYPLPPPAGSPTHALWGQHLPPQPVYLLSLLAQIKCSIRSSRLNFGYIQHCQMRNETNSLSGARVPLVLCTSPAPRVALLWHYRQVWLTLGELFRLWKKKTPCEETGAAQQACQGLRLSWPLLGGCFLCEPASTPPTFINSTLRFLRLLSGSVDTQEHPPPLAT